MPDKTKIKSPARARLHSFAPIVGKKPHTLILGTMPGVKSLAAGQYYAHPQNAFWRLMGDIYGAGPDMPYEKRIALLAKKGVAVWDVFHSCEREGSLDSSICAETAHDFESFLMSYPTIRTVVFDSLKAEKGYQRHVLPSLSRQLAYARVPSPSPANAGMPYAEKLKLWKMVLVG